MIRAITTTDDPPKVSPPLLFLVAELVLVSAVPFIGWRGLDALLDSRAGTFVQGPTPSDPGWEAFVDPSSVSLVVEVDDSIVTGAVLITQPEPDRDGGAVILVPGDLSIAGTGLSQMTPDQVATELAGVLDLAIESVDVADEARWAEVLAGRSWTVSNPDPVPAENGDVLVDVGTVVLEGDAIAAFVGRPAEGAPFASLMVRRELWWATLLADPPTTDTTLGVLVGALGSGDYVLHELPTTVDAQGRSIDEPALDALIADTVPFPEGYEPGDRVQVRLLARSPEIDVEAAALELGRLGYEVVRIGNAPEFDDGPTAVISPASLDDDRVGELVDQVGADSLQIDETDGTSGVVTVLIGR